MSTQLSLVISRKLICNGFASICHSFLLYHFSRASVIRLVVLILAFRIIVKFIWSKVIYDIAELPALDF
ncbi:hypothetical protein TERTU_3860 [Teredinibacter turnerae T7901]|uniref:Uncharacterized protein n=1 Tax=Teredinibacter turnerae (strain ATCC 39867 / T7901) TaxID=377629 RepID=C5BT09_TERTT|nr:hypothetical protein TERTU_3860 [Teredinibacter turnerae T7901]